MNSAKEEVEGTEDFISEGWHKLDDKYVSKKAPIINWGSGFHKMDDAGKIQYLAQLACTMNQAAALIQDERDELNKICAQKEKQIQTVVKQLNANNQMMQAEVTRMNEMNRMYHADIKELQTKIKELQNGNQH